MKKLKRFLLIDDSKATNFFNKTIIEKVACVEEIITAENGKEALDTLRSDIIPEVIFLDINMPVMNGWDFLAEYQKLDPKYKGSVIVLMLGASLNDEDKKRAESVTEIKEFNEKMLTKDVVCNIVTKYFKEISSAVCVNKNEAVT